MKDDEFDEVNRVTLEELARGEREAWAKVGGMRQEKWPEDLTRRVRVVLSTALWFEFVEKLPPETRFMDVPAGTLVLYTVEGVRVEFAREPL